ncbi:MAG: ABC transporter permease [Chthoniobacteraceae bacterium]|jgi:ribose transport system permease protein|nr:ABC transporter permease [Chthoniobacteraceae bacterium]NBV32237.1 ABC transporter permease [Pseudomonadota bacterium]
MKKIFGILGLLIAVCLVTASLSDSFLSAYNVENVLRRSALFGILSIGVAFVIITGGIDLSLGSVVCLVGCALPWLLTVQHWPVPLALLAVVTLSLGIGLFHGLLITKLRIQPFIVTLCGLLLYRGIARGFTADQTVGFGNEFKSLRLLATGKVPFLPGFDLPAPLLFLAVVAILAAVFLNRTIFGRYLLALGRNPQAATYSGISTQKMTILAYVVSSGLAGLGGILFVLDVNSAQPVDFGSFYELYAIAAAVLGGCSLRGGEGSIVGVLVGAALMQVLRNMITLVTTRNNVEFAIIGAVILLGVVADELTRRIAAKRRTAQVLQSATAA